jgi:RecA/RadA recombinase
MKMKPELISEEINTKNYKKKSLSDFDAFFKNKNVVDYSENPFNNILTTDSPSFNWMLGNTHGLPLGYSLLLWGAPKSGKTLICNNFISVLHRTDSEAVVLKFNTEFREKLQRNSNISDIDTSRIKTLEVNGPADVFDFIVKDVPAMCQQGLPLKLIVIDSLNGIFGKRGVNSDSIEDITIGDAAITLQEGFKRIIPVLRKYNIALIATAQQRAEMNDLEKRRGNEYKVALASGALHALEYHVQVIQNRNKDGKVFDENSKDLMEKNLILGHKIRVVISASSCSPQGRTAEFTLNYSKGIINIGEEVARLATDATHVVKNEGQMYIVGDQKYRGWDAFVNALETNLEVREKVVEDIKRTDQVIKL